MSCDMNRQPFAAEEKLRKRRIADTKSASLKPRTVLRPERAAQMRPFDCADSGKAMRRKDEARQGVPGSVGARTVELIHKRYSRAAGRERAVNGKFS